jgi:biotin carboxyl carrier protein
MDMETFLRDFSLSRYDTVTVSSEGAEVFLRKKSSFVAKVIASENLSNVPEKANSGTESSNDSSMIKASRVGLFYPKVKVGDTLEENFVFGQIRAMNIMHELKAGKSGVVRKILVSSGDAVEYGDLLLELEGQA